MMHYNNETAIVLYK